MAGVHKLDAISAIRA